MHTCPACGSLCGVPILRGKLTPEGVQAVTYGLARAGGCLLTEHTCDVVCVVCEHEWLEREPHKVSVQDLISFAWSTWDNVLSPSIARYGDACLAYGRVIDTPEASRIPAFYQLMSAQNGLRTEWEAFVQKGSAIADSKVVSGEGR